MDSHIKYIDVLNIPFDLHDIITHLIKISNGYIKIPSYTFDKDKVWSKETTIYLYNNNLLRYFSNYMLSNCLPNDMLNLLGDKICWDVVIERIDLSDEFIKTNLNHFDITKLKKEHLPNYNKLYKLIENKKSTSFSTNFIINIIKRKYTFEQLLNLLNLISLKVSYKYIENDDLAVLFNSYFTNYNDIYRPNNIILFKKFINCLNKILKLHLQTNSYIIYDTLTDYIKITSVDLDYLLKNELILYYNGFKEISPEFRDVFFKYRNTICSEYLTPFNIKNYECNQIEEMINLYKSNKFGSGINEQDLWSIVSYHILGLNTSNSFINKNKNKIDWYYLMRNIITNFEDTQEKILENFLIEHNQIIYDKFLKVIFLARYSNNSKKYSMDTFIFPEVFIKTLCQLNKFNNSYLSYILGHQKLSIELIEELISLNYINDLSWKIISLCQILTPEFINKYIDKLDWTQIKYNQTWSLYDDIQKQTLFNKLPSMFDVNGDVIFGKPEDKEKILNKLCIKYTREGDYFIVSAYDYKYIPNSYYSSVNEINKYSMLTLKKNKGLHKFWEAHDIIDFEIIPEKKYKDCVFVFSNYSMECSKGAICNENIINNSNSSNSVVLTNNSINTGSVITNTIIHIDKFHKPLLVIETVSKNTNKPTLIKNAKHGYYFNIKIHYKNIICSQYKQQLRHNQEINKSLIYLPLDEKIIVYKIDFDNKIID